MRAAMWLAAVALPLAAQPKLLVNAQVDTRSAAGGLETTFKALAGAQPQPEWIGYEAPVKAGRGSDCQVVYLEPPDRMVILFRVEAGAVVRLLAISPDCQIDAGGVPVHWLTGVKAAESVALLIQTVKASPNAEVRRQAMACLRRTGDAQAASFFEDVLKR